MKHEPIEIIDDVLPLSREVGKGRIPTRGVRARRPGTAIARTSAVPFIAVLLFSAFAAAWFVSDAMGRWRNFQTNAYDLAFFDQIIWNTAHGRWFETSFVEYNFAGQHFEPVLLLFAIPYRFGAGPILLTVTEGVVAALAAVPLFFAAKRFGTGTAPAFALSVAWLINPYTQRAVQFDFHPEVMVALPAFGAAWAIAARRYRLAMVFALCTLLLKEDAAFVALALAGLLWVRSARREAFILGTTTMLYLAVVVLVLMPMFRDGHSSDLVGRYGHLADGRDGSDAVRYTLLHPWVVAQALVAPGRLWTAALFIMICAPFAVLRPWLLLGLFPGLCVALLTDHPPQQQLELHYSASVLPLAFIASMVALGEVHRLQWHGLPGERFAAVVILVPALIGFALMSPLTPWRGGTPPPSDTHIGALEAAIAHVPDGDSVAAQSAILPRLSQREAAYEFPAAGSHSVPIDTTWVVVDRYGAVSSQSLAAGFDVRLGEVRASYERVFDRDGVEVFRRRE